MDYITLYNTIETKVNSIYGNYEEKKLEIITNIYLVALGFRTAYLNSSLSNKLKDLDFIVYVEYRVNKFIVNKEFYESNINLFEKYKEVKDVDEADSIVGKIINYPCAGKLSEINSKKRINIEYIIKKDSVETQLFNYLCPYNTKEKSIIEAKKYLKNIKKVLKFVNINIRLQIEEYEALDIIDIERRSKIYNYRRLYDTIVDSVSEEQKNDLNLIVNIYLVAQGVRTAYLTVDQELSEATKKLDFIVYRSVKFDNVKNFEFVVNKDFYKKYSYLFTEFENTKYVSSEYHQLLGKILNYPCATDLYELESKKYIILKFFIRKGNIDGRLHNYQCPDEDIHIENAEAYLNKMKSVLEPINIKATMKFSKSEANLRGKYYVLLRDILDAIKDIWSEDLTYVYALNILLTSVSTIKPITIFDESDVLFEKLQTNVNLLDKLKSIPNILVIYGPYYGPSNVNKFIVINKKLYPEIKSQLEKLENQKFIERGKRDKIIGKLLGYDYILDLEEFNKSNEPYYILRYKAINEKEYILYVNSIPLNSSLKKAADKLKILNDILTNLNFKIKMDLEVKYRLVM